MSFKRFDPQDIVVSADTVTGTVWSGNKPQLTQFFTSSVQAASQTGKYYLHVYNTGSSDVDLFGISVANSSNAGKARVVVTYAQNNNLTAL